MPSDYADRRWDAPPKDRRDWRGLLSGLVKFFQEPSVAEDAEFEEGKHPRDHGKFSSETGAVGSGAKYEYGPGKNKPLTEEEKQTANEKLKSIASFPYEDGGSPGNFIKSEDTGLKKHPGGMKIFGVNQGRGYGREEIIDPREVYRAQQDIPLSGLQHYIDHLDQTMDTNLPDIAETPDGERWVVHGHTRLGAQLLAGRNAIKVMVHRYEKAPGGYLKEIRQAKHKTTAKDALSTSPNSAIPTAAGVMLVDPTQHVLFVKRSNIGDHPGKWAFPGGGCHPGETTTECARRETQEETGYDLADDGALEELCRHSGEVDYTTYRAFCDNRFNPALNEEHTKHLWAPWGQWPEPLHPGVEQVLDGLEIGEDATLHRGPDGYFRQRAEMTEMLPLTTKELRDDGVPRVHAHPGPRYNGAEAADMALDRASVREKDADGRLHVEVSNISKSAINEYMGHEIPDWESLRLDPNRRYKLFRDPTEIAKAVGTFNNLPVLSKHVPVSAVNYQPDLVIGSTGTDAEFVAPFLRNSLVIWAKPAIDAIESGEQRELSSAYRYTADMTPGSADGVSWDGVMRNLIGNHVSIVRAGRAGSDVAVGDSMLTQDREWFLLETALRLHATAA